MIEPEIVLRGFRMNQTYFSKSWLFCLLGFVVILCGCCINVGGWGQQRYERTEEVSAPMAGVELLDIDTSFGDITINGTDTMECNIIANIVGRAPTEEEAMELAEQTQITLVAKGKTLVVRADKPKLRKNRSIAIDYEITVPRRTGIECKSSYGDINLSNIAGDVTVHSSFGEIEAKNIAGKVELDTSYGEVGCSGIICSEFKAKSSFGKMEIDFSDECPAGLKAEIETSYGEVEVDVPSSFAGEISVETSFGKVRTDLPILVTGEIGKDKLMGKIGTGPGRLDIKTSFGSVSVK